MTAAAQVMKRDRIVEDLRRRILSGGLPRGAQMGQDELARQFHTSITPVREALRLLEAEGLVVSEPHRGARVAGVDIEKVKAIYVLRRLAEGYAMCRVVSRLSRLDLSRLHSMVGRMEAELASGDLESFRTDNREFHFFFYDRCGLVGLRDQIDGMWTAFPWDLTLNTPERSMESHREHVQILDAVESGDLEAVTAATEAHIAEGFAGIARRLVAADYGQPIDDPFLLEVD